MTVLMYVEATPATRASVGEELVASPEREVKSLSLTQRER